MGKNQKNKPAELDIEYNFDFDLWGIVCISPPYKIAWELNRVLPVSLKRIEALVVEENKMTAGFDHYHHESSAAPVKLFRNKNNDEWRCHLLPEFTHFDYILHFTNGEFVHQNRLQELLKIIPSIEILTFIPLSDLKPKTKTRFVF